MSRSIVEIDCGECGTTLSAVASTVEDTSPYRSAFLACPRCGAAWQQVADGSLTKRRARVIDEAQPG